jgi:putative ABC transport system substrate-binding protein
MKRRTATAGLALGAVGALGAATPVRSQPATKLYRIGILGLTSRAEVAGPQPRSRSTQALLSGMRELGYIYGEHFVTEARGADSKPERFAAVAAELAALPLDVIVGSGPTLPALKQATMTIPIVMAASLDPVGVGLVQSLARPGGNITGLSLQSLDTVGKRLELLKEVVPGPAPMAVMWNGDSLLNWQAAVAAARVRGWKLQSIEVRDAARIDEAFKAAIDAHAGSVVVFGAGVLFPHARQVAQAAAGSRLPAIYELRNYVDAGGLMSYGADINEIWRRAAVFVHKILKGAKPADLPVEQPTDFELVISLKTAKALGLSISHALLLRADEVIS